MGTLGPPPHGTGKGWQRRGSISRAQHGQPQQKEGHPDQQGGHQKTNNQQQGRAEIVGDRMDGRGTGHGGLIGID